MAMSEHEKNLVAYAKAGNGKAYEELYNTYYDKILTLARVTVKNNADAEDIMQQAFTNAWENIANLSNPAAFSVWLQKITVNLCYRLLQKKNIAILADIENDSGDFVEDPSSEYLPAIYAERDDLRFRLGMIIDGLSDIQKQTIVLFYFNELKVEEIAYIMECNEGTVKKRLFDARRAIRTEIEEEERKSGEKFYGVAGLPMLSLKNLLKDYFESCLPLSATAEAPNGETTEGDAAIDETANGEATNEEIANSETANSDATSQANDPYSSGEAYGNAATTTVSTVKGILKASKLVKIAVIAIICFGLGLLGAFLVDSILTNNDDPHDDDSAYMGDTVDRPDPDEPTPTLEPEPESEVIEIVLSHSGITDNILAEKVMNGEIPQNVNVLLLEGNQISDITPLQSLTNLTLLELTDNQISDISPLQLLTSLTSLGLGSNLISDISLLQTLTNLTSLSLLGNQISDVTPILLLPKIQSLTLHDNQIIIYDLLASHPTLTHLDLSNNPISDFTSLRLFTRLEGLVFCGTQISDLTPLQSLTNLTYLELSSNQISDITPLQSLTNLVYLQLEGNPLSSIIPLQHLKNLKHLDLRYSQVSDVTPLQSLTNLTWLNLQSTLVNDVSPLYSLLDLRSITLFDTPVSLEEIERLREALPDCEIAFDDWFNE